MRHNRSVSFRILRHVFLFRCTQQFIPLPGGMRACLPTVLSFCAKQSDFIGFLPRQDYRKNGPVCQPGNRVRPVGADIIRPNPAGITESSPGVGAGCRWANLSACRFLFTCCFLPARAGGWYPPLRLRFFRLPLFSTGFYFLSPVIRRLFSLATPRSLFML